MHIDRSKLLAGKPISVGNICAVYPLTLSEIVDLGSDYQAYLQWLCIGFDDLISGDEIQEAGFNIFDVIVANCEMDNEFLDLMTSALQTFLKEKIIFSSISKVFYVGDMSQRRFIDEEVFSQIQDVLVQQNCIIQQKEERFNPANEGARRIAEQIERARSKINKTKKNKDDDIDLSDIVSSFCARSRNTNILQVWDFTMYQFNNQFKRVQLGEDYDITIQSLLQGADPKKVKLSHYLTKLD